MMIYEVIRKVSFSSLPSDSELTLPNAVSYPIETQVKCFTATLFDGVVGNTSSGGISGEDEQRGLRMSHFVECSMEGQTSLLLWNKAPSSALAVDERTLGIV
jgi:hypothetical protein